MGQILQGRYRVVERIGAGGMGTVYRAVQVPFERDVAVKVLGAEHSRKEQLVQRFATEALIISKLRHPNTLKLYDFGRIGDGRLYIVTEHLAGQPLDELLKRGKPGTERSLKILGQVCDSLAEAHGRGIVHRDLKPANIFIERIGEQEIVKVLDFGVARVADTQHHTVTGTIFGTPAYMSPEQAHGEEVDARADLYALGIIAYECFAGALPFSGTTPMSVLLKQINDPPTPLNHLNPPADVHPQIDAMVMGLLEKDLERRPRTAAHVRRMIDDLLRRLVVDVGAQEHLHTLEYGRIPNRVDPAPVWDPGPLDLLEEPRADRRAGDDRPGAAALARRERRTPWGLAVLGAAAAAFAWYVWKGGDLPIAATLRAAVSQAVPALSDDGPAAAGAAGPGGPGPAAVAGAPGPSGGAGDEEMGPPEAARSVPTAASDVGPPIEAAGPD